MTYKTPTYCELEQLLTEMGFVPIPTTGTHRPFRHPETDTIVVLPGHDETERVIPIQLVAIRKTVLERGVIEDGDFDSLLDKITKTPAVP